MSATRNPKSRRYGTGSVYSYSRGGKTAFRWQAYILVEPELGSKGFRRRSMAGFASRKAAEESMQEALRNSRLGKPAIQGNETFESWAKQWLESQPDLATTTFQGYEKIIRVHLIPHLGALPLVEISSLTINSLYLKLKKDGNRGKYTSGQPLSSNSLMKIHVVLGAIMDSAVENHKVSINVVRAKSVKAPTAKAIRNEQAELRTWKKEELALFLNWSRNEDKDDLFPLWHVFCHTGMRRGEGVALKWDDINWETKKISIRRATDSGLKKSLKRTKTGKSRSISVSDATLEALKEHRAQRAKLGIHLVRADAFVFGTFDGSLRNPGDVGGRWSTALRRATKALPDLPAMTIKGLRHTHATILLEAGVHAKVVQERLGHSNYSTTMNIYSHVTETMQQDAVELFNRAVNGQ
jgi:integrase